MIHDYANTVNYRFIYKSKYTRYVQNPEPVVQRWFYGWSEKYGVKARRPIATCFIRQSKRTKEFASHSRHLRSRVLFHCLTFVCVRFARSSCRLSSFYCRSFRRDLNWLIGAVHNRYTTRALYTRVNFRVLFFRALYSNRAFLASPRFSNSLYTRVRTMEYKFFLGKLAEDKCVRYQFRTC